jgi:hypothetical protein
VNAIWNNPNGTQDCEVRGGRISPSSIQSGVPQFANINNTRIINQTNGSTVDFNIVLYNNPNVPFVIGQTYGYEVRCFCADMSGYSDWSGIVPESTFIVPPIPGVRPGSSLEKVRTSAIMLYPNPSSGDFLNVQVDLRKRDESLTFAVNDVLGRVVQIQKHTMSAGVTSIRLEFAVELQSGLYSLSIVGQEGLMETLPFIVQ